MSTSLDAAPRGQRNTLPSKERKKSVLDLRRHFTGGRSKSSENVGTPFRELISIWSRFPSHTRAERNGPAGGEDGVVARDFIARTANEEQRAHTAPQDGFEAGPPLTISDKPRANLKTKSMTLREPLSCSPADRARRGRKGILGRWKRLYRSSSSDLRKYTQYHGHRSSLSLGDPVHYPELECLPGIGAPTELKVQLPPTPCSPTARIAECKTLGTQQTATSSAGAPERKPRPGAVEWGSYYGDCVGSLSALKSESDIEIKSAPGSDDPSDVKSLEMRDSTVNFQEALGREQEKLKQQLLDQVGRLDGADADSTCKDWEKRVSGATNETTGTVLASSVRTKDLRIPGSFG